MPAPTCSSASRAGALCRRVREASIGIDQLAEFVFVGNVRNARLQLNVPGIQGTRDLFYFLVDLLCKGLVLMFGANGRIMLDELTQEQFDQASARLLLSGVRCHVQLGAPEPPQNRPPVSTMMMHPPDPTDSAPIETYKLRLATPLLTAVIWFSLVLG